MLSNNPVTSSQKEHRLMVLRNLDVRKENRRRQKKKAQLGAS
jgi:hypothetical protein